MGEEGERGREGRGKGEGGRGMGDVGDGRKERIKIRLDIYEGGVEGG
jgi:hypothetical protein